MELTSSSSDPTVAATAGLINATLNDDSGLDCPRNGHTAKVVEATALNHVNMYDYYRGTNKSGKDRQGRKETEWTDSEEEK